MEISLFENVTNDRAPRRVTLEHLAEMVRNSPDDIRALYPGEPSDYPTPEAYKAAKIPYDEAKRRLSAAALAATMEGGHKGENVTGYTGLILFDIDHITADDVARLRADLWNDTTLNLQLLFVSPSGRGLKGATLTTPPPVSNEDYGERWRALTNYLHRRHGVANDQGAKGASRLAFIARDPAALCDTNRAPFPWQRYRPQRTETPKFAANATHRVQIQGDGGLCELLRRIEADGCDIFRGYCDSTPHDENIKFGRYVAHELGEAGRSLFHSISSRRPSYDYGEYNRRYTELLKSPCNSVTFAALVSMAKRAGVDVSGIARKPDGVTYTPPPPPAYSEPVDVMAQYFLKASDQYTADPLKERFCRVFDPADVVTIWNRYGVTGSRSGHTLFWGFSDGPRYLPTEANAILYDDGGHRVAAFKLAATLKRSGHLPADYTPRPSVFGAHVADLLGADTVYIVESEKTALCCSLYPGTRSRCWVASRGCSPRALLEYARDQEERGRRVVLVPDTDESGQHWRTIAERAGLAINNALYEVTTENQHADGLDWADLILSHYRLNPPTPTHTPDVCAIDADLLFSFPY